MIRNIKIKILHKGAKLFYRYVNINKMVGISLTFGRSFAEHLPKPQGLDFPQGIAHLCEHIILSSPTKNHTKEERLKIKRNFSASNGATSSYYIEFNNLCSKEELLPWLEFVMDGIVNLQLTPEELEIQKRIVKIERNDKLFKELPMSIMYANTVIPKKYHKQYIDIIGAPEELDKITVADVYNYIQTALVQERLCIGVCGNVSYRKIMELLRKTVLCSLPVTYTPKFISFRDMREEFKKNGYSKSAKERLSYAYINCEVRAPATNNLRKEKMITTVMNMLLYRMDLDFFRQKHNICYSVGFSYGCSAGVASLYVEPCLKDGDVAKCLTLIPEFLHEVFNIEITEEKKKMVEKQLKDGVDIYYQKPTKQIGKLYAYIKYGEVLKQDSLIREYRYIKKHLNELYVLCLERLREMQKRGNVVLLIKADETITLDFTTYKKQLLQRK